MEKLQLRVDTAEDAGKRRLRVVVEIDGQPVGEQHTVDWHELFRSLRGPGEFFVWTARSGEPLDANIHDCVMGARTDTTVTWEWLEPISLDDCAFDQDRQPRIAEFDAKDYDRALWQGWWQACKLVRADKMLEVCPQTLGEAGLLALDRWFRTDDARPFAPLPQPQM